MEFPFLDVVLAKKAGDRNALNEASLGRLYHHYKKSREKTMGIISAYRTAYPKRLNIERNKQLASDIRNLGLGFVRLAGHWRECQDPEVSYEDCPEDQLVDAVEKSFGIIGIPENQLFRLVTKYDQDAAVFVEDELAYLLTNTGARTELGKFHPDRIAKTYSAIKGKSFVFEWTPQNYFEGLIKETYS